MSFSCGDDLPPVLAFRSARSARGGGVRRPKPSQAVWSCKASAIGRLLERTAQSLWRRRVDRCGIFLRGEADRRF